MSFGGFVLKEFIIKHRQLIFNIYLAINFTGWAGYNLYQSIVKGNLDYVEISFTAQTVLMIILILIRWEHRGIDKNILNQTVALIAFLSGAAFIGQPASGGPIAKTVSGIIVFIANVIGIITMLNLGRSFGIIIAVRKIKTAGLYSIVRHPMYGMDILLRIGFVISHLNWFTSLVFIISTALYVYRAILEERFLALQPEYQEYIKQVKYRFIPYVF
jgi:protein-S-isoprenylcysteine O-methyltransferase Ste14